MVYFFPYIVMSAGLASFFVGGNWVWLPVIILFAVFPLIEVLTYKLKFDSSKFKTEWGDAALMLTAVFLTLILITALYGFSKETDFVKKIGFVISAGALLGAFGITSAHELVHRRDKYLRAFGVYNLMLVNFAHWGIEHVFGHHKYAATPQDPATARKNEILYLYWFREYVMSLIDAARIEPKKVAAYWACTFSISAIIYFYFGTDLVFAWWGISAVAILLLQTVDYIEHYALLRQKNFDGFYMAFKPQHSWDTSSWITNITLFNLGFHAHHHMKASVPFEDLVEQKDANQMPFGYSVMVLLAFFPFIFLPLMNNRQRL